MADELASASRGGPPSPFGPATCSLSSSSSSASPPASYSGSIRPFPNTVNKLCIGSSFGWLILICDASSDVSLFNPITFRPQRFWLPSLSTLPADVLI
ncbi:hypothetical protein OPV22_009722 [Ensete ventricosum]|uniref:Uncharacterized protein n=1 Tax=Ensete ventricosum TaxID=4639 RepID=A0AAV8RBP6_ENSVE|nr:hypothetical protein OPV22_009722 [Ensete ventricosum]